MRGNSQGFHEHRSIHRRGYINETGNCARHHRSSSDIDIGMPAKGWLADRQPARVDAGLIDPIGGAHWLGTFFPVFRL